MVRKQVSRNGFVSMLIARLIPGPPFAVWNYAAGIARMNFGEYFLATLLGTMPAHIVFAYCADALFNGTMTHGEAMKRFSIVAVLLTYEQSLVSDDDLSQVKKAFDLNGYVGIVYFVATALSLYLR